jgi:hypothetical protein
MPLAGLEDWKLRLASRLALFETCGGPVDAL